MIDLKAIGDFLWANKEWLFQGLGAALIMSLLGGAFLLVKRKPAEASNKPKHLPNVQRNSPFDRAPRLEFADGVVAEITLLIDLRLEHIFLMLKRFKTWEDLQDSMSPRVHVRLCQIMEAYTYEEAKGMRAQVEKQLMFELAPEYAEYGVQLRKIAIGSFVRCPIDAQR